MQNKFSRINTATTYRDFIDILPLPTVIADPDLSILYVNPAFVKLTGFSAEEAEGKSAPYPWWPPTRHQDYFQELNTIKQGRNPESEWLFRTRDGRPFWVRVNVSPVIFDSAVQLMIACWTDITALKNEEQSLRSRLETLSSGSGGAFRLA